jgi:protease-4
MSKFLKIGCLTLAILFFIGLTFIAGVGVGSLATSIGESAEPKLHKTVLAGEGDAEIAIMSLQGIILTNPAQEPFALAQGIITPDAVGQTLELTFQDENVKAIIIRLDSPGGSAVASDEIYQHIKNTAAQKPVVILVGDTAASGGYYIASAASYIFANPASMIGSIGVIAEITDVQELFKKIGLEQETYKSGEFKDLFSSTRDRTPEEQQMIQELLDTTYGIFVRRVAAGRNMEIDQVFDLADGKIYSGAKAKELGLIDDFGYRWEAFDKAKQLAGVSQAKLVAVSTKSLFESLFSEIKSSNPLTALLPQLQLIQTPGVKYLYK